MKRIMIQLDTGKWRVFTENQFYEYLSTLYSQKEFEFLKDSIEQIS